MTNLQTHSITNSYWHRERPLQQRFPALTSTHETEILIIGAGITGLSAALELTSRGHRVTLCDAETIGAGTTAASTGHLDAHPEIGPVELVKQLGEEGARTYTRLRLDAIDRIERRSSPACDFVRIPGYYYSESSSDRDQLRREFESAKAIGLQAVWADEVPIARAACGYEVASLARFNCGAYLQQLADLAVEQDVTIFEKTFVEAPAQRRPTTLNAGSGKVRFDHVVCAVHCNYNDSLRLYAATPPYQSYVIAARVQQVPQDGLFWDNSEPYFYVRRADSHDPSLLLIGGCDHRTGMGNERESHRRLEAWADERFKIIQTVDRWSAELFEPVDGLPMIGLAPGKENVWVAVGLSGIGLTLGTAAAGMLADAIDGKPMPLADMLSAKRSGLSSPGNWLREQATAARNYAERVLPSGKVDADGLAEGEGAVGKDEDGTHVAICRDKQGCTHRHSPICTHMGGVVHWNEVEQTWDCPVHGGRFSAAGERIYGPPEADLEKIKEKSAT